MQKSKRQFKLGHKIIACILVMQIVVMTVLTLFITNLITANTRQSTINNMKTIAAERSQIIENYVLESEGTLTAYSRAGEILDIMKNPENPDVFAKTQAYTEKFSKDIDNLEGIYASEWNTHVLTHTNAGTVGITTRKDEAPLKALQQSLLAANGVYNTGIIMSPATGKQIVSLYSAVFDEEGNPAGLVGLGIFTSGLVSQLDALTLEGMENAKYCMVNARDGKYIFVDDEEKVAQVAEEEYIVNLCNELKESRENVSQSVEYRDEATGEQMLATYYYMANRGWIFMINDSVSEIFASANQLRSRMIVFCIFAVILLAVVSYIIIDILTKPMKSIENSITALSNLDISDKEEMQRHAARNDELGSISGATESLVKSLQGIVATLRECGTTLDEKAVSLQSSAESLVEGVTDNVATTEELCASMESTNNVVSNVNNEIGSINESVGAIMANLQNSTKTSDSMIGGADAMKSQANQAYVNGQETLKQTKTSVEEALERLKSLAKINELASSILDIAGQTNLLSLNASIEAARAGEAGRGFAVVAGEIGALADTSKNTASAIRALCEDANDSIRVVNECFASIIRFIEEDVVTQFRDFADQSSDYSEAVKDIKKQMDDIYQATSALEKSVKQISDNAMNVNSITEENRAAIGVIAEKNEDTARIADTIQEQSEQNKEMAGRLEEIIGRFSSK